MPKYQINVMSDKEFFKVAKSDPRYEEVDDTNLGFADPERGKAYVRFSSWPDLMKGTMLHEFEHLVENDCPKGKAHEDRHGIKHKKFFKQGVAPLLPYIGAVGGSVIPGLGNVLGGALGGALGGGIKGAATGGKGGFGKGALTGGLTGGAIGGVGKFLGGGGETGFQNLLKNPIGSLGSAEGRIGNALQSFNPLQAAGQGAGAGGGTGALATSGVGGGGVGSGTGLGKFFGGNAGKLAIGGGLLAAGAGYGGKTHVPQLGDFQSAQDLRKEYLNRLGGQPTSPLSQSAFGDIQNRLKSPFGGADPAILQQVNDTYNNLVHQYTSNYKLGRPNADLATDTQYRLGIEEIERRRSQDLAGVQQEERRNYEGLQTQAIAQALGIDQDTLQSLGNLSADEIELALAQTGLDEERKNQIRQMLGQLGGQFVASGAGVNNYPQFNILGGNYAP